MKTLVAIFLFLILLWGFNSAVEIATRPLQAKAAAALAAPRARPLPTARTVASAAPVTGQPPPASYHHSTPEEVAESQRRADEAMRVLAPNTPEIPLVLPAAPPQ